MRMRKKATTDDYRKAATCNPKEDHELFSLEYEWVDKPHRLVYDLCGEIDHLQELLNERDNFIVKQGLWQDFCDTLK